MSRIQQIRLPIELETIAPLGRIGLIALASDFNIEQDLRRMLPRGVEIFTNRVLNVNPLSLDNLRSMADDISRAAAGILPDRELDVMIFACTSGAIAIGAKEIEKRVWSSRPGIAVTNPASAVLAALDQLKARRISILTPYTEDIDQAILAHFNEHDLEVINIAGLGFEHDTDITGIPVDLLQRAALDIIDNDADALFISCTALRTSGIIEAIERETGKAVVSSNQALVWQSLKLLGYTGSVPGLGRLLENFGH